MLEPTRSRWRTHVTRPLRNMGAPPGSPNTATLLYVGIALLAVMVVIAIATNPLFLLLQLAVVVAALVGPRQSAKRRFTNDIFQRTRKITRDEEYEADVAQDRRRVPAALRGDWRMLVFRTHWENVRKSVRPQKYVRVEFGRAGIDDIFTRPLRVWMPQREDITRVVRRWAPLFEPYHQGGLDRLRKQVEAFFGQEVEMEADTTACVAVFVPKVEEVSLSEAPLAEVFDDGRR
jgi:hypothetical protein